MVSITAVLLGPLISEGRDVSDPARRPRVVSLHLRFSHRSIAMRFCALFRSPASIPRLAACGACWTDLFQSSQNGNGCVLDGCGREDRRDAGPQTALQAGGELRPEPQLSDPLAFFPDFHAGWTTTSLAVDPAADCFCGLYRRAMVVRMVPRRGAWRRRFMWRSAC